MLYPFVNFSTLGYIIHAISIFLSGDRNWIHYILTPIKELVLGGSIGGNDVLWFLTSLFLVQFLFNLLMQKEAKAYCIAIGGIAVAFLCHLFHLDKPAYLANVAIGIALYALGYMWKEKQFIMKSMNIAIIIYIGVILIHPSHIDLRTNALYDNGIYLLAIAFSISGCLVINNLFKHLPRIPIIHYIGAHSMVFYVTHMLILELLPLKQWGVSGRWAFAIMCLSCIILPPIIRRITPNWLWEAKKQANI